MFLNKGVIYKATFCLMIVMVFNIIYLGGKNAVLSEMQNSKISASMLKGSTDAQRKRLKNAELEVRQSTHKMRDLSINIK